MEIWPHAQSGHGPNPPVLLLHGYLGRGSDWDPIAALLGTSYPGRLIQVDLPGHGAHLEPRAKPLQFATLADELAVTLTQLEIERAHVVGYSLGGRLALHFALGHPDRIHRLVLESASPGINDHQACLERASLDDERATQIRDYGLAVFLKSWYQIPLFASLQQKGLSEALIDQRRIGDADWMARVIGELSPGRQPSVWDRLKDIVLPTLWISGEYDTAYQKTLAAASDLMASAQHVTIPDAGHNTHLEQPALFIEALLDFLLSAQPRSRG